MTQTKLIVIYPTPTDVDAFEKVYSEEHVPMAVELLAGKTKIVATRVVASPTGSAPFHRIAEVYFPSSDALAECAASEGGQKTVAHAAQISTGGPPILLIAEEDVLLF